MSEIMTLPLAITAGRLSVRFSLEAFGGLSRKALRRRPALWFLGSLMLRTGLILAGVYIVSQGHWSRLVACLLGFLIARVFVVRRLARATAEECTTGKGAPQCVLVPMNWFSGSMDLSSSIAPSSQPGD